MNTLRTTEPMEHTENFDSLWSSLKDRMKEARGDRKGIDTMGHLPFTERTIFGGEVRVSKGDVDGSNLRISGTKFTASANVNADDLLSIAAYCMAAAEEIEADKAEAAKVRQNLQHA